MANVKSTPTKSLVRVGDGRGFVVEEKRGLCLYPKRFVVTAVHCLPRIPKPPGRQESLWEETLSDVLGRLGRARPRIWAECLFIDQVGDIAVLGSPDNEERGEQAEAHEELVEAATPLSIGAAVAWDAPTPVSLIALDGSSILGAARRFRNLLWTQESSQPIVPGMSGSPCLIRMVPRPALHCRAHLERQEARHHRRRLHEIAFGHPAANTARMVSRFCST